jgi:hypothetical protein
MPKQPKKELKRPDTPLAPTPIPKNLAEGVVISKKDEKAHPEDFKYLKKK